MSTNKQKGSISFRFNSKSGDDHLEEVHNFDDDRSSDVNSEANSRASTPMKSESSKLSDILSSSPTTSKVKSSISDNSVKDFFTSKLNRGRSFDQHGSSDDSSLPSSSSPGSSSKWFNESWKKFQQIIEERKEKSAREKEKERKEKDSSSQSIPSSSGGNGGSSIGTEKLSDAKSEPGDIGDVGEKCFRSFSLTEPINENLVLPSSIVSIKAKDKDGDDNLDEISHGDNNPSRNSNINKEEEDEDWLFRKPSSSIKPELISTIRNEESNCEPTSPSESCPPFQRLTNHDWWIFKGQSGFLILCSSLVALFSIIITIRLPFPSYINGFILGVIFSLLSLGLLAFHLINLILKPTEDEEVEAVIKASTESSQTCSSPAQNETHQTKEESDSQIIIHKEWFHELVSSQELGSNEKIKKHAKTQLVFIRLQGTFLRVSEPQSKNLKTRKLTENSYTNFAYQRHYDLINLKRLYLWLPNSIRNKKKYLWVKKYPIILEIDGNKSNYLDPSSSNGANRTIKLILFARTHRSKEEWYWRFKDASKDFFLDSAEELKSDGEQMLPDSNSTDHSPSTPTRDTFKPKDVTPSSVLPKYEAYMHQILHHRVSLYLPGCLPVDDSHLLWFNSMLGRVLFEFLNNSHWSNWASKKIQRKLSRIKLPYFMQTLTLKNIDLGQNLPRFLSVPKPPVIDEAGLWVDFQIDYCGGFAMTLETKLNLMRLKDQGTVEKEMKPFAPSSTSVDMEDFSEPESIVSSSEDDEKDEFKEKMADSEGNNGAKILKFVDKLAASKYFQQATDYKYIKRAMEGVSNTPLVLTVFVQELSGVLSINIPPPPSDRLWYGFRGDPNLVLSARPRLGEHRVSMSHAIEWIEKKLQQEFNKLLVIPNMDDIILSVMMASNSNIDIQ